MEDLKKRRRQIQDMMCKDPSIVIAIAAFLKLPPIKVCAESGILYDKRNIPLSNE